MKSIKYLAIIFTVLILSSCGGNTDEANTENLPAELKGYEALDLTPWGFQMSIMVPNAEDNGEPVVNLTERGALEISVGQAFGIEIMYGEGDIELLKMDLKEDLVFTSKIIKEDSTSLIYSQDIPDSGIKTQNHFFYKALVGTDIYEVRDLIDGSFAEPMIESMLSASKTLKGLPAKTNA